MIEAQGLARIAGIRHGFFTRDGGVSTGIYRGLNTGLGSRDARASVLENRKLALARLGGEALVTPYQHHSADVVIADQPWPEGQPPKADAVVTTTPGIAIAVNTADCTPVIFAHRHGGVVGVAHAGWKGALAGILEASVAAMARLGASAGDIAAAIGPTISRAHYEVGGEFRDRFIAADAANDRFFTPAARSGHFMFDLPAYVARRLAAAGVDHVETTGHCTYADETRFFSYRRMCHRGESDYGRQLSAIVITA